MVHQYQLNGYNIVLDTCSGAIHVVDEVAYDIIALYPDHTADEIVTAMMEKYGAREDVTEKDLRDCIDDVEALKQAGKLYTPDTFADMAGTFKERSGDVVKALCLHVAHTCNLNCSYCFASQGKYHGDRALMSYEVGKQALDFLMDHSGTRHNLEVDFFGGEPLMNWDVVKQLVEYARCLWPLPASGTWARCARSCHCLHSPPAAGHGFPCGRPDSAPHCSSPGWRSR